MAKVFSIHKQPDDRYSIVYELDNGRRYLRTDFEIADASTNTDLGVELSEDGFGIGVTFVTRAQEIRGD